MGNKLNKEIIYDSYKSIKSLAEQIANETNLITKVFLIQSKSIKNFLNILLNFNALAPNQLLSQKIIEEMKEKFSDYELDKNIEIYYKKEQFQNVINSENNEFLVVNDTFIQLMDFQIKELIKKIVILTKKNNIIEIKLDNNEEIIILKQEKNGLFKVIEKKIFEEEDETIVINNNINILEMSDNYTNNISNIVSFLDCFKNITKIRNYFLDNKNLICNNKANKKYAKFFYDYLNVHNLENLISKFIQENKDLYNNQNLIESFYDEMHYELNEYGEHKFLQKNYEDIHLKPLSTKCRNDFVINNKSIISDIFYFEIITILHCKNCNNDIYRTKFVNKLIINVEGTRKYKTENRTYFKNLDIIDCLKYFRVQKSANNAKCVKCFNENLDSINKINYPPEILTIMLDYGENFKYDIIFSIFTKDDSDDTNINIDFAVFAWNESDKSKKNIWNYKLIGFCSYYDNQEGKYFRPFYLGEDNKWHLHRNQENIEVELKERDQGKPYILFYQRI